MKQYNRSNKIKGIISKIDYHILKCKNWWEDRKNRSKKSIRFEIKKELKNYFN
jgi:hypothetical protein